MFKRIFAIAVLIICTSFVGTDSFAQAKGTIEKVEFKYGGINPASKDQEQAKAAAEGFAYDALKDACAALSTETRTCKAIANPTGGKPAYENQGWKTNMVMLGGAIFDVAVGSAKGKCNCIEKSDHDFMAIKDPISGTFFGYE